MGPSKILSDGSISIHALREEGDPSVCRGPQCSSRFLSTPSARRATEPPRCGSPCGHISIHALREEGDALSSSSSASWQNFYPRPPRGGRPRPKI